MTQSFNQWHSTVRLLLRRKKRLLKCINQMLNGVLLYGFQRWKKGLYILSKERGKYSSEGAAREWSTVVVVIVIFMT